MLCSRVTPIRRSPRDKIKTVKWFTMWPSSEQPRGTKGTRQRNTTATTYRSLPPNSSRVIIDLEVGINEGFPLPRASAKVFSFEQVQVGRDRRGGTRGSTLITSLTWLSLVRVGLVFCTFAKCCSAHSPSYRVINLMITTCSRTA